MASAAELAALRQEWLGVYTQALQADSWGQVVEAMEGYQQLSTALARTIERHPREVEDEKVTMHRLILCFNLRAKALAKIGLEEVPGAPSKEEMRKLRPVIEALFSATYIPFPLATADRAGDMEPSELGMSGTEANEVAAEEEDARPDGLLPPPALRPGATYLQIVVDRFGIKDAERYIAPFLTVSVHDKLGTLVEPAQNTPPPQQVRPGYVHFGCTVNIQTPLETLSRSQSAIFFEFRHHKAKKGYISCRCWAFMELDEIREGEVVLETYKKVGTRKGADFLRKRIKLHTIKPLYVHLSLSFRTL